MKMSLVLKKALMVIAGVGMVTAVTAMATGCNNSKEGPVDGVQYYHFLDENNYIVIDGVLHYGSIYTSADVHFTGYRAYDIQSIPLLQLKDGSKPKTYQFKAFEEKPNKSWYETECEDCMNNIGQ